ERLVEVAARVDRLALAEREEAELVEEVGEGGAEVERVAQLRARAVEVVVLAQQAAEEVMEVGVVGGARRRISRARDRLVQVAGRRLEVGLRDGGPRAEQRIPLHDLLELAARLLELAGARVDDALREQRLALPVGGLRGRRELRERLRRLVALA